MKLTYSKYATALVFGGATTYLAVDIFHSTLGGFLIGAGMALLLLIANKLLEKK